MYFDADLMIRGHGVSVISGADGSALTNAFLAKPILAERLHRLRPTQHWLPTQ